MRPSKRFWELVFYVLGSLTLTLIVWGLGYLFITYMIFRIVTASVLGFVTLSFTVIKCSQWIYDVSNYYPNENAGGLLTSTKHNPIWRFNKWLDRDYKNK